LTVSTTLWAVSAAIAAEPDSTAAKPLATAIPALADNATSTVAVLSPCWSLTTVDASRPAAGSTPDRWVGCAA